VLLSTQPLVARTGVHPAFDRSALEP